MSSHMAVVETVILKERRIAINTSYFTWREALKSYDNVYADKPPVQANNESICGIDGVSVPKAGHVLPLHDSGCPLYPNNEDDESIKICKAPYGVTLLATQTF